MRGFVNFLQENLLEKHELYYIILYYTNFGDCDGAGPEVGVIELWLKRNWFLKKI